jgi:hypothetical protein
MASLPGVPAAELVTRTDLSEFRVDVDTRCAAVDTRFDQIETRLQIMTSELHGYFDRALREAIVDQNRTLLLGAIATMLTFGATIVAVFALALAYGR